MPLASTAALELRLDVAPDLPEIWADRHRLLQVFENLIGNAIKFTKPGGEITVGGRPRDDEGLFSVADTGAGIAERSAAPRVRSLLAGTAATSARRGPGAPHRQGHRRGPRRTDLGREHARSGQHVLLHPANGGIKSHTEPPRGGTA